jgi:hypothetical protein
MNSLEITHERLEGWKLKLAQQDATPLALVGIGHGRHRGNIVLCIPENGPSDKDIADTLRGIANKLSR